MTALGANVVRVYHVDSTADHSGCMEELAKAGIYALIDLDTVDTYIMPTGSVSGSCARCAAARPADSLAVGYPVLDRSEVQCLYRRNG